MNIIGIDIGGSTTKIVGLHNGNPMEPMQVKATDPITSVFGAFGKYISTNNMALSDINRIMVTGVGSSYMKEDIYNIKTIRVGEFDSIGLGGLYLTKLDKAVIVSMGTGTAFVKAQNGKIEHLGGTGVGGGTLLGLSSRLLNIKNFESIIDMSANGNLFNVDLTVGDISKDKVKTMPPETTASNFGKISDYATKDDIALGIINMVFQTIGMMAVFSSRMCGINDVVLCGNLTTIPNTKKLFDVITNLHGVNFYVPEHAEYATAFGAALMTV